MKNIFKVMVVALVILAVFANTSLAVNELQLERYAYSSSKGLAYNGNTFVSVGSKGMILVSQDGENWNSIEMGLQRFDFRQIVWTGEEFVALTFNPLKPLQHKKSVCISQDGYNWNTVELECEALEVIGNFPLSQGMIVKGLDSDTEYQAGTRLFITKDFMTFEPIALKDADKIVREGNIYAALNKYTSDYGGLKLTEVSRSENLNNWKTVYFNEFSYTADIEILDGKVYYMYAQDGYMTLNATSDLQTWEKKTISYPEARSIYDCKMIKANEKIYFYHQTNESQTDENGSVHYKYITEMTTDGVNYAEVAFDMKYIDTDNCCIVGNTIVSLQQVGTAFSVTTIGGDDSKIINFPMYRQGESADPKMEKLKNGYLQVINGKQYVTSAGYIKEEFVDKPYDPAASERFATDEYKKTPIGYMVRTPFYDPKHMQEYMQYNKLTFYDNSFNPVHVQEFNGYVDGMQYYKGLYYCRVMTSITPREWTIMISSNMTDWKEFDGYMPDDRGVYRFTAEKGEQFDYVSLDGIRFIEINYEFPKMQYVKTIGEYLLKRNGNYFYLSKDGIYFLEMSSAWDGLAPYTFYEDGEKLVMRTQYFQLTTPKQDLYNQLEQMAENATYVVVKDKLLGFSTAPITEEDRTLVPMRFLFENLDAEISWDEATQTATAVKGDTSISFCIDNHQATVNGEIKEMDVPARLVNDKTMVPLRFLSEGLGYTVNWNEETRVAEVIE